MSIKWFIIFYKSFFIYDWMRSICIIIIINIVYKVIFDNTYQNMTSTKILSLPKFDISLCSKKTIMIIGKRGMGKTTLIKNILNNATSANDDIIIITPSVKFTGEYGMYKDVYENVSDILPTISKNAMVTTINTNPCSIVLEDAMRDTTLTEDVHFRNIIFNSRHFNIQVIISMQYALGLSPALRGNIDYVFIFNILSLNEKKRIYEQYGQSCDSFLQFSAILDSCISTPYTCLVINNCTRVPKDVTFFWYAIENPTTIPIDTSICIEVPIILPSTRDDKIKHLATQILNLTTLVGKLVEELK
jgi:energy-coupling factor transporter ATP-binding protein EcfA2